MKLYELTTDYERVRAMLSDGDVPVETIAGTLEAIQGAAEVKLEAIGKLIRENKAEAEALKAEEDRLKARRNALENNVAWLMRYAQAHMEALGLDRVKGVVPLRLHPNPPRVNVTDPDRIPSNFKRAALTLPLNEVPEELLDRANVEVNRSAVLEAYKNGADVPGTEIVRERHLRVG